IPTGTTIVAINSAAGTLTLSEKVTGSGSQGLTAQANDATDALGNFAVTLDPAAAFTSNGLKTVEIFATDDAGSVSNKVTLQFTLNDSNLPQPPPTQPPVFTQNLQISPADVKGTINGIPVTN